MDKALVFIHIKSQDASSARRTRAGRSNLGCEPPAGVSATKPVAETFAELEAEWAWGTPAFVAPEVGEAPRSWPGERRPLGLFNIIDASRSALHAGGEIHPQPFGSPALPLQ